MDEPGPAASGATLVETVMAAIRQRIAARTLMPGSRLPSIRAMAKSMQVSKSTVVEAYERLAAEGAIRSRPGSGFFAAGQLAPLSLAQIGPRLDRAVDPLWISRQSLEAGEEMLKPGCGWLPASWMPQAALRRALRAAARADDGALADYGTPLGLPPLRQLLARRMAEHGVETSPDQIMLTDCGTQAIDLLCRFLLEPGDAVLVDDPCYFNFHALLRAHQAKVVGVPYTPSGPDIELFAQALAEHRPRLYITNSGIHNPTGAILSPVTAHRLLKLADQAELTIIEDDIFADFEHSPAPRLAAFDGLQRDWMEGLTDLKIATTFGGTRLSSELVLGLLKDGSYRKHVEQLRARLSRAMAETAGRLKMMGIVPWIDQPAGMFLWCRLPDGIDAAKVARHALSDDVVLAPGNAFSLSHTAGRFMRFNVAQCADERILRALEKAMEK
ncbi:MAG: PLP-dependent aminotransferase family protein [Alphaproteobacteria bacterium]|nr:PLP-dependent aminotransferase family protein [Alphaproteobacteria bacterium]